MRVTRTKPKLSRERRTALYMLLALGTVFVMIMAYQRFVLGPAETAPAPAYDVPLDTRAPGSAESEATTAFSTPGIGGDLGEPELATEPLTSLVHPLGQAREVVQAFEVYYSSRYGDFRLHPGIDLAAAADDEVVAAAAGKVIELEQDPDDGMVLVLDHGSGLTTRYANLGEVRVTKNSEVTAGQTLGSIANGTAQTNPHLHFEVWLHDDPVNPMSYLEP